MTKCDHQCTGNCEHVGCNCLCGEWHCPADESCRYTDPNEAPCPNHPTERDALRELSKAMEEYNCALKELKESLIKLNDSYSDLLSTTTELLDSIAPLIKRK